MFHYLYSNDMRVSELEEKTINFAKMFLTDSVPSAKEDKSVNNNANTVGYYLNLANKGACARAAASGDCRGVILNFIKTFQYPNPRSKQSLIDCNSDGIKIAPLREIVKILFLAEQIRKDEAYLTKDEILNFVFYNKDVAKVDEVDRQKVLEDIFEYRKTKKLPQNIVSEEEREWKHEERQIKEILDVLEWSDFIVFKEDVVRFNLPKEADCNHKAEFYDILTFEKFWLPDLNKSLSENRQSYASYCDLELESGSSGRDDVNYSQIKCNKLDRNIQDLYFGAPGTGKSYEVSKFIETVYPDIKEKDNPFVFKTTVYPDYSYYDFVGTIMPKTDDDGRICYDFREGVFSQALAMAFEYTDKDIFLIVEEMSRGNIASIFGDIFQLLDRDINGISEYSINNDLLSEAMRNRNININKIYLPSNLHILGTVNTSDQNVHVMDTAFKRRFGFIYSSVEPVSKSGHLMNSFEFSLEGVSFEWNKFYMALNDFIVDNLELSEDKQIGQFFIKFDNYNSKRNSEQLKFEAIQNKLLHYLWEDIIQASFVERANLFDEKYNTFSKIYNGFKMEKNIFSNEFLEKYKKIEANW